MLFSASTGGFYSREIHGNNMPADVVEITAEEHAALINGQTEGKVIAADANGRPVLQDPPPPTSEQLASIARATRDALLSSVYDVGIIMALRARRLASTPAEISYADGKIAELDAYAEALQAVPDQPGFPASITWPTVPTV